MAARRRQCCLTMIMTLFYKPEKKTRMPSLPWQLGTRSLQRAHTERKTQATHQPFQLFRQFLDFLLQITALFALFLVNVSAHRQPLAVIIDLPRQQFEASRFLDRDGASVCTENCTEITFVPETIPKSRLYRKLYRNHVCTGNCTEITFVPETVPKSRSCRKLHRNLTRPRKYFPR